MKQLTFSDVESMVESRVRESATLDYKRDLPGRTDRDKREFCEDVAALANTRGGIIIYGVAECSEAERESGVPASLVGVMPPNLDAEALRLTSVLRSGLAPRVSGVGVYVTEEEGGESRRCVIVSVPQSLSRPHMVTSGGVASRFWARSGAGKYFMDVGEIRDAFKASGEWVERLRLWHADRAASVAVGQGAVPSDGMAAIVLHIVPLAAFSTGRVIPLSEHQARLDSEVKPLFFTSGGWSSRWNLDGYLVTGGSDGTPSGIRGYSQVFGSGIVEAVDFACLRRDMTVPARYVEEGVLKLVRSTVGLLSELESQGATAVLMTLVNVRGFRLVADQGFWSDYESDRDFLSLPEAILEEDDTDVQAALRPVFDSLWRAFGSAGSPRYRGMDSGAAAE